MASKPDKFEVKFWVEVDVSSKYLIKGLPYLGKDAHRHSNRPVSEYIVLQLKEPYLGKGRNVTIQTTSSRTSRETSRKREQKRQP